MWVEPRADTSLADEEIDACSHSTLLSSTIDSLLLIQPAPSMEPSNSIHSFTIITVDIFALPFVSLVSMIRNGCEFDEELVSKASTLIDSITLYADHTDHIDLFLMAVEQDSTDPAAVFVDSVTVLLSSPHPSIFKAIEDEETHCVIIGNMFNNINPGNDAEAEFWLRGRILLQTLEQEGEIVKMEAADCFEKSLRDLDWGAAVWFGWGTPKHGACIPQHRG
ncbi:hypothetical protein BLNAU_10212 [Blattamonas nauphoetae]|uniref:Uncharacterized protein n=1 Tax=Blattamonas nauphoetae TaxID=2049346 RepID=A0ABQ9XTT2_9EUKA|nr:hypothetical protein BLNAU_10212 [Blattamonas nauphoetae]